MKLIILVSSVITTIFLGAAIIQENISVEWKDYQKRYREILLAQANTEKELTAADIEIKLRQEFLPDLNRTDRCTTCHIGVDNPKAKDVELPISTHSGNILKDHPPSTFGCTVCHNGQGLAITEQDAHGDVRFWPSPLLRAEMVYTSCGRCHYENDLYGAEYDLFTVGRTPPPILTDELTSSVRGGSYTIARGKELVLSSGCLGCHKYRGRGGTLGPDISHVGDKGEHDYDFSAVEGAHTVEQWLFEHFKNPEKLSPGTMMPDFELSDDKAFDLTMYLLSLHRKSMPASHTPVPPRRTGQPIDGHRLYSMFCSGCHGTDGQGSTVRYRDPLLAAAADVPPELMVPSLNNPDTLAVASNNYFQHIIHAGRSGTSMIAWGERDGGGLRAEEVDRLVAALRNWEPPAADRSAIAENRGAARAGKAFYEMNCAACHGRHGEGGIGTALYSMGFLSVASDQFLGRALIEGRPNSAMPSWRRFDSQQISDVIAYVRNWHSPRNGREATLKKVRRKDPGVSARIGDILYKANCVMCHGPEGEGDLAPSIATQEFLTIVDNGYLYETISTGRPGTGMPAWRHLSDEDIASLIFFQRQWQKSPSRSLPVQPVTGDWDMGALLFEKACTSCHGAHGEGGVGPQLNNPVFLQTTTDAMLWEWVAYGKAGTQMRSFRKGGQGMVELSESNINDLVSFIRSFERRPRIEVVRSPNGRPELGQLWFAPMCSSCHGVNGEGASGPSLANQGLLRAASDGFLMATMAMGRDGTEMRPVKKSPQSILSLSSDQVNDLVACIRSWENAILWSAIPHNFVIPWDLKRGDRLFQANCSGCHGMSGKAEQYEPGISAWAPALNNEEFLAGATDGFLQATIVRGRIGTAMLGFGQGMQGLVDLSKDEIDDVAAFIRRWSGEAVSPITIPAEISLVAEGAPHDLRETTEKEGSAAPQT
jgi:mono/diheme cytochrome c family protein